MAYLDTHVLEAEAADMDGYQFDEVRLAGVCGEPGLRVWWRTYAIHLAEATDTPVTTAARKRLLVRVAEPECPVAVQRVRAALKWVLR